MHEVVRYSPLPFIHNLEHIKNKENFDLYSVELKNFEICMQKKKHMTSCLRLLTTASLKDILLKHVSIEFADWLTEWERDEVQRLLHYQQRGYGHWPLQIEWSRDITEFW